MDGVQVYSDDDSVIEGVGRNDIFLGANAALISFTDSTIEPTILLGTSAAPVSNNTIVISETATVMSTADAIETYGSSSEITNMGAITAEQVAVDMVERNNTFTNHGTVTGSNNIGARVWANGEVVNTGSIYGGYWGVALREGGGEIFNSGTISGNTAVYMSAISNNDQGNSLNNSGELLGVINGVETIAAASEIINTGEISVVSSTGIAINHSRAPLATHVL